MIQSCNSPKIDYLLISVGCNDLDSKDHKQVFSEAEVLLQQIRTSYPGIKIIFSEITPRNDMRDSEVIAFNDLLAAYATKYNDVTVVIHKNLRDSDWSMYKDAKHIYRNKIPKFAANIISGLKHAYGISNKSELFKEQQNSSARYFVDQHPSVDHGYGDPRRNSRVDNRLGQMAGYDFNQPTKKTNNENESLKREIFNRLQDAIKSVLL